MTEQTKTPSKGQLYYYCAWYAWGQQDAGTKLVGDAFEFGGYYLSLFGDESKFIPSVQSAFKTWNEGS